VRVSPIRREAPAPAPPRVPGRTRPLAAERGGPLRLGSLRAHPPWPEVQADPRITLLDESGAYALDDGYGYTLEDG
jgi:hypothetical protein